MRKGQAGIVILASVAALAGAFVVGRAITNHSWSPGTTIAGHGDNAPAGGVERKRVAISGMARGPATAPITIVAFSDFQCPFCGRAVPTIEKVMKEYPGKVRFFFRHFPLPFHQDAPLASEAALAAEAQGKFWEMHDKLFADQKAIKRPDLERHAKELGLDMGKFTQALDTHAYKAR